MSIYSALDQAMSIWQEKYPDMPVDDVIGTIEGIRTAVKEGKEVASTPDNKEVVDTIVAILRAA